MKRLTALLILCMLLGLDAYAGPPTIINSGTTSAGILTDSNCDQAKYYSIGTLCQDTDDGKLYKGTGSGVEEIAAGSSGDMTATTYVTDGKIKTATGGTGLDTSGSTGYPSLSSGTWSILSASDLKTALGLVIGTNVQAYDADLTTYAGITPSANVQTLLGSATFAAFRTNLELGTMAQQTATDFVPKSLYDAYSILYADTDNTPAALTVGEATIVGRATGGNIAAIGLGTGLSITGGNLTIGTLNQNTTGTAAALAANPTDCAANQFATTIAANGNLTCAAITAADLGATLTPQFARIGVGQAADATNVIASSGFSVDPDGDVTAKSLNITANATPTDTFKDSDAPGTDKEIAKVVGAYVDGADGSENGTLGLYAHEGGTSTEYIQLDGKNADIELKKNTLIEGAQFKLPSSDADPTATAGYIRHDSTVTGLTHGALRWHDGTAARIVVDLDTGPSDDDYVVAYDADADKFYMKTDATGVGGSGSMTTVKEADSQVGGADIVTLDFGAGFDLAESPDTEVQITLDLTEYTGNVGSTSGEIGDVYMGDGKIIYGQADQSNTLTSSATGWNLNKPLGLYSANDPDVAAAGKIAWDANGNVLRGYDGTNQIAVGRKLEEIHVTVYKPNSMDDAQRDHFWIWSNESGMSFVVTGWKGWSTSDDTTLNIVEEDADGANDSTVDAVEIATGSGPYTGSDTTITAATIENGHLLYLDFDDTDDPALVKITIYGYYNADVN